MRVTVVGAGKMGLPLACQFARRGADVTACDIRQDIVAAINSGVSPIDEPGVAEVLADLVHKGLLKASTDTRAAHPRTGCRHIGDRSGDEADCRGAASRSDRCL